MNNWDRFWSKTNLYSISIETLVLKRHYKNIFKIYKKFLDPFKPKNPEIIELGCGSGELTARLIERYGGSATLLDNSEEALKLAIKNFKSHGINAIFLQKNLFNSRPKKKFDIVHSEGLVEHFLNDNQRTIIDVHKRYVKKNGFIIFSVPRPVWYYKIAKWYLEKRKKWPFGFEKAMNKNELKEILERNGLNVIQFLEYARYSFALAKI